MLLQSGKMTPWCPKDSQVINSDKYWGVNFLVFLENASEQM
jgi:hypothetical protein